MIPPPRWIWPVLEVAALIVGGAAIVARVWFALAAMLIVVVTMSCLEPSRRRPPGLLDESLLGDRSSRLLA